MLRYLFLLICTTLGGAIMRSRSLITSLRLISRTVCLPRAGVTSLSRMRLPSHQERLRDFARFKVLSGRCSNGWGAVGFLVGLDVLYTWVDALL